MRRFLPLLLAFSACSTSAPPHRASAPVVAAPESVALPRSAPRPALTLAPGDLVRISVFQQPDLEVETRIPDNGMIALPLIGGLTVIGLTPMALQDQVRDRLAADYLQSPSVTVTIKEYSKRRVFIVGGVTKPDSYELAPDAHLSVLQLVAAAGGFSERANRDVVQVIRRQGGGQRTVLLIPLAEVERRIAQGRADADLELWPDDLVVVPSSVRVAHVLGAVNRPGSVDLPSSTRVTVSMAVSNAGSYTKFASIGRVQVLRRSATGAARNILVDLDAVLEGRVDLDVELQPGDVVWVPERGIF